MLENARSQFVLLLLAIAAALACVFTMKPAWGPDLKGGSQLRYEVPPDILGELTRKENASIDKIMEDSISVIRERIDPNGTSEVFVTRSGETDILIELPYFDDPQDLQRAKDRIANLGKLEMRIVAEADYHAPATDTKPGFKFDLAGEKRKLEAWLAVPGNKESLLADLRNIRLYNEDPNQGPIAFGNLAWYPRLITPSLANPKFWERPFHVDQLYAPATVKAYADADFGDGTVPEAWQNKKPAERFLLELMAINMHEKFFSGEDLDPAGVGASTRDGSPAVSYKIAGDTSAYADWSEKYINKASAIILNGVVKSAPRFISRIPGEGQITGSFTQLEVEELVKVLRTGSLRVEPELVSTVIIGPSLGQDALDKGLFSLLAGAGLVFVFMLWYYRFAGTIACVTLVLNVALLWAAMLFMQATVTLPGLGGIVLTLGMAVDANVLIYERMREEIAKGKDLLRAVRAGFERAMSAILDSNITTFLAGLVLFNVGSGPVRGFAVTLMAGIVTTVFTQFFVTRLLFHWALESKKLTEYHPRALFTSFNLDFVKHIGKCLTASTIVIVAGLSFAFLVVPREVMLGIDFTGGANMQMIVAQPMEADQIRERINRDAKFAGEYTNVSVNTIGEPDASGRTSGFNLRLKLTDTQRDTIADGRKAWRDLRREAEKNGQPPPPAYQPPYLAELKRIFADVLVKPAYSNPKTFENPQSTAMQWARIDLHFSQPIKIADAHQKLVQNKMLDGFVSVAGDPNAAIAQDVVVEWQVPVNTRPWELFELARKALADLTTADGKKLILSDPFPEAQEIQGRLVNDMRNAAIAALILSWGLILLYLRVRFHEYKYGVAAVVALIHDVLVAFVAVVFVNYMGWVHAEISLSMIACFLTIIGYSVNDTIVIFDRIRENLTENAKQGIVEPMRALINRALNQTMSRTLLTSGVTLFVVVAQFAVNWGSGSDLESFAFAMIVGMVSGVYSTVYIAAPILILMHKDEAPAHPAPVVAAPAPANPAP